MSHRLDAVSTLTRYDRGQVAATLALLPLQIRHALSVFHPVFPAQAKRARALLAVGMGGSALGVDLVRGVVESSLRQLIVPVRTPELPAAARLGTFVVVTSYSGETAETLAAARLVHQRRLPMAVVTVGGPLATQAQRWGVPTYRIDPAANPSGQPRLGVGSMTTALLVILDRLGWRRFAPAEQRSVLASVGRTWARVRPAVPFRRNPLKRLAVDLVDRFVLSVASDRYWGNAHILANQLNENAKTFAAPFALPELNHHLLEGLQFPSAVRRAAGVILRGLGDEPLERRFDLTGEVFRKNDVPVHVLRGQGSTPLGQAFSLLTQSSALSFYLALAHRIDPAKIPWVTNFKRALTRR